MKQVGTVAERAADPGTRVPSSAGDLRPGSDKARLGRNIRVAAIAGCAAVWAAVLYYFLA